MAMTTTRQASRARAELNAEKASALEADFVHTGPGTLAGRYLRSFWQPVALSAELAASTAKSVRVLGEDFTLYRGSSGTAFLVDHRCAHRGAQLSVGWIEDQIWENSADEFHVAWVHSGGGTHRSLAEVPQMFAAESAYGIERRSRRPNGKVRVTQHLMPNCTRVIVPPFKALAGPGGWRDSYLWFVPRDDESTLFFGIQQVQVPAAELDQYRSLRQRFLQESDVGRPYWQTGLDILAGRRRLADYYDHPQSAHIEDIVAQAGQGPIADRVHERLGRTDVGVILMRKLWTRELRALAEGKPVTAWRYAGELPETGI